jgi:shikimate dehydrogenase
VAEIRLVNRTRERADGLAKALSRPGDAPVIADPWPRLPVLASGADLIVNATSIGWHGDEMPFDADVLARLPDQAVVMDLTYRATALLRAADARGLRSSDGLPMLIHQGARAFELWTGQTAPVDVMTAAVLAEQARRA